MINQLALNAISNANARYDQKTNKPVPVPETGIIVGFVRGQAKIETQNGFYFAKSNTSGGGGIGDKASLHITTQGTNFYNLMPR
jgi:hypothetical protein